MSLTEGLNREMLGILQSITKEQMDFEELVERTEIVGPELNYYLVRMKKMGLVEYGEMSPSVSLTDKGKRIASEVQAVPLAA
jgi:Mn-dependent DtxR family transcriptional regulator